VTAEPLKRPKVLNPKRFAGEGVSGKESQVRHGSLEGFNHVSRLETARSKPIVCGHVARG